MFQRKVISFIILVALSVGMIPATAGATAHRKITHPARRSTNPVRPWFYVIERAGGRVFREFTCIIHYESTSTWAHPNLGDNNRWGSSGIFQIIESTWLARSGFHFPVWTATPAQQALGALRLERADGFGPWSTSRFCGGG